jgi:septum formation inhibitor-activating ATPase MinD
MKRLWTVLRYCARIRVESLRKRRSFSFMIVDVPAEIGAGYLQSASQASPP